MAAGAACYHVAMTNADRIVAYYRRTAWQYRVAWSAEHLHYGFYDSPRDRHDQALSRMVEALAYVGEIWPGTRVLDAGCGLGGSTIWLAKWRHAHVVGLTLVPEQAAEATRRADLEGLVPERVFVHVRDYHRTGYGPGEFDVVWALESFCYARPADFLREAFRILKPGGWLVIADGFATEAARTDPGKRDLLARWARTWAVPGLLTIDELGAAAGAIGFQPMVTWDVTDRIMPDARLMARRARRGPRFLLPLFSSEVRQNVEGALLQERVFDEGAARYRFIRLQRP